MNWYHRDEGRYVEYGTSFTRLAGVRLQALAHRHDLQHERRAPVARHADGVRDARRRRRAHGRDDVPHVPRPPPPRGGARDGADADRLDRVPAAGPAARASSSTPTCSPRAGRGCRSQLGLPGIRDQHAGCVGAYLVEHDLFDFLLLSLPDNDTHSHKHGPDAQVTSLAAADRQLERADARRRRPGRVPRGPRRDRLLGPLAVRRSRTRSTCSRRSTTSPCCRASGARARGATRRSRCARARARRRSTCSTGTRRAALVPRVERDAAGASRASTS